MLVGLAAIHQNNVAHLDIKETNILICRNEANAKERLTAKLPISLKIADFGIAVNMEGKRDKGIRRKAGTRQYMAAEQHKADSECQGYDPFKADIFALAVVLFRLIFKNYPLSSIELKKQL